MHIQTLVIFYSEFRLILKHILRITLSSRTFIILLVATKAIPAILRTAHIATHVTQIRFVILFLIIILFDYIL